MQALRSEQARQAIRVASWATIPVLFVAMSVLDALHLLEPIYSPRLIQALDLCFLAVSAMVAVLVTRSFRARGEAGLLLLSGGIGVWGLTLAGSGTLGFGDLNAAVTILDLGALLAGACHAWAAVSLLRAARIVPRRGVAVVVVWAGAIAAVALVARVAHLGALPVFFVEGRGGTPVRQAVLSAAVAAFALGAAGLARGSSRSSFRHWYALGLGLIGLGLFAALVHESSGGPLGWLGRTTQYLGGVAMLVAALSSVREAQAWTLPLGALLRQSEARYRALFENMSEGFLLAETTSPGQGRSAFVLADANPAAEALAGIRRASALGRELLGLLPSIPPAVIEACARVMRTGEPARFEIGPPCAQRHLDFVAFRPEPGRLALLFSDGSERARYERALEDANARLSDVDRNRSQFLAVLSHELRNPLAPIRNAAATLEQADPDSDRARRAREILGRQVDQMTRLVEELLDLTRISTGKIRLQHAELDLGELVRRAGEDRRDLLAAQGLAFHVEVHGDRLRARADSTRLVQVVGNLLQNAAKYTPAGGAVTLSVHRAGEAAEIRVRDTGVGIEPAFLGRLFDPFTQGEATLDHSEGGLGLGLALVKGLVELHGGSIEARSEGPGRGTEFVVRLPLQA